MHRYLESECVQLQSQALRESGTGLLVALNGPLNSGGEMSADTQLRLRHAGALAIVGNMPLLFVGGQADTNRAWTEDHYGESLSRCQLDSDASSHDTVGNAISTRRYVDAVVPGADIVAPVTLQYHVRRARYCFQTLLPKLDVAVMPPDEPAYSLGRNAYLTAAQIPIMALNRWQLRGFDASDMDTTELEHKIQKSHRYNDGVGGSRLLRILDKWTSGDKEN